MFLYFCDWTNKTRLKNLKDRGAPIGEKLIKVYASVENPQLYINRPVLVLVSDCSAFPDNEAFEYPNRGIYTSSRLEEDLTALGQEEYSKQFIRSLFRFGNRHDIACIQYGMEAIQNGEWVFKHPFDTLHGIDGIVRNPAFRNPAVHLDIFSQRTLSRLGKIIDLENKSNLLNEKETATVIKRVRFDIEGNITTKER